MNFILREFSFVKDQPKYSKKPTKKPTDKWIEHLLCGRWALGIEQRIKWTQPSCPHGTYIPVEKNRTKYMPSGTKCKAENKRVWVWHMFCAPILYKCVKEALIM